MTFAYLGEWLSLLALKLPLEIFVFFGSFVEEIVSPIPSQIVMITAGTVARIQGFHVVMLMVLGVIGAIGKVLGAWIYYWLGDRLGHALIPRYGKYIGVSEQDIERIRIRFQGTWKDDVALFILRFIPIVPSAPVSIVCGMIRMNARTYTAATFLGALFRNWMYLAIGFAGVAAYRSLLVSLGRFEGELKILGVGLSLVVFLGWVVYRFYLKKEKKPLLDSPE